VHTALLEWPKSEHATIVTGVYLVSGKHQHGCREIGKPIQEQEGRYEKVRIGKNCWIGNGAVVMANLGVQNVVAAGSVVVKDTLDYAVVAGNPATVIRILDDRKDP
jgi:acetyltransferase-like isoleucine patch superfamily enzyme